MSMGDAGWARVELVGEHADTAMDRVCHAFGVTLADLKGCGQDHGARIARNVAYYVTREATGMSYQELGRLFHRDHTTVLSGVQRIRKLIKTDATLRGVVERLVRG